MKTIILYKSKYGSTARYAAMLGQELGCEPADIDAAGAKPAEGCGAVIFAGGIYAGGVAGWSRFAKLLPALEGRRTALLCVGASPYDGKALAALRERCKGLPENVPLFYARGAWDESVMSFKDRTMCKLLQKMVARQPEQTEPWMRELLAAMGQKRDWVSAEQLQPLLEYIRAE